MDGEAALDQVLYDGPAAALGPLHPKSQSLGGAADLRRVVSSN
jgi:hypothetical protein